MKTVSVLMSTYNGEKYLREQIESLFAQKGINFKILVRDDGSSDGTLAILDQYASADERFSYYIGENMGPAKSFLDLISKAEDSDYYALCDQDDVWDDDKLLCAVNELEKLGDDRPTLYYSNLRVVDQNLKFCRLSHDSERVHTNRYSALIEGLMTGCTGVFNHCAQKKIKSNIPEYCSMHDTWIYMICKFLGATVYDIEPHISYRQHEGNAIGTYKNKFNVLAIKKRAKRLFDRSLQPRYNNAKEFLKCFENDLTENDLVKVREMTEYKESIRNWLRLLFDREINSPSINRDIRYRLLIVLRII